MKHINDYFWAKKTEENSRLLWLPLTQHLEDTKNIAGLLWEHWLSEGQKVLIENSINVKSNIENQGKRLAQFLGAVHDIGKATPAFQTQKGYANSVDLDIQLLEKLERAGFSGISSLQLASPKKSHHSIAGQYLLSHYGVDEDIATIIGGHHGRPVDDLDGLNSQKSYPSNYYQDEKKDSLVYQKWKSNQEAFLNWALTETGFNSVSQLPKIKQPAQVILSGLLIMSDWIASNEHFFPLLSLDETDVKNKSQRIETGFKKWKKSNLWQPETFVDLVTLYQERFGFSPRNFQLILSQTIEKTTNPGIVILEAPMGIGKTEAALAVSEQLSSKKGCSGLFFGLPTQATSNGIFKRIEQWTENIKGNNSDHFSIQLVHGKAALNTDFIELLKGNTINMDDSENGSIFVNEWFSGRKTSALDDFVVGTVDQ